MSTPDAEGREVDALFHRQSEEDAGLLVRAREAEPGARTRRSRRDIRPEQLDRSCRGRDVACDHVEERRLPGAVRAEDRTTLTGCDVEVDVAHSLQTAEAPADPPQAEGRLDVFGWCCFGQRAT